MDIERDGGKFLTTDPGRKGEAMQTWTGIRFYPVDPRAEDVDLLDIAYALGNMSRYNGHCRFYSVAEHAVLVSYLVEARNALDALHHDDEEAYITDLIRPVKRNLSPDNPYFTMGKGIMSAAAKKFGLSDPLPQEVKNADTAILGLEKEVLHPRSDPWQLPFPVPYHLSIRCYPPFSATMLFLRRHFELSGTPTAEREQIVSRFQALMLEDLRTAALVAQRA
jgi:hypothetical protein